MRAYLRRARVLAERMTFMQVIHRSLPAMTPAQAMAHPGAGLVLQDASG